MRPLILLGSFERGGAETVACELVRRWAAGGASCVVAAMRAGGPMKGLFEAAGARVYEGLAPRRMSAGMLRVARLARRHGVDVLIVVDPLRNGLFHGLLGALLAGGVATVCWCHSSPSGQGGNFVPRLRTYRGLGWLDLVVCVSRHQRGELARAGLRRRGLAVVANGLDLEAWGRAAAAADLPRGAKVILSIANAMPDKDFQTLAQAMRLLAARRGDVRLVLAGRGTDQPAVRGLFAGLEGRVTALGECSDVPALLAGADVAVLSSRSETFGLAALEAMAAGTPVVAGDLGALRELCGADAALLVRPGDAAAMAGALERVLDDNGLARRLALAGRERAGAYGSSRIASRMARLIEAAIKRRGR
jgi:glycosyltransferase involved in cell wall biosynthesis